jgi:phage recombination protein Bet
MSALVKTEPQAGFSAQEIDLIKNQIAKGASDLELKFFLELCKQSGLNPFTRQIYLIERRERQPDGSWKSVRQPQTSIDGFRSIAEDSARYAGQVGPHWCGPEGEWHDVWTKDEPPVAARVGVLRDNFKEPLWAVAKYKEYVQRKADGAPTVMWAKMPDLMIAKCAEALALRKAFPQKLGGLYTSDEMAQAEIEPAPTIEAKPEPPSKAAKALTEIAKEPQKEPQKEPEKPKEPEPSPSAAGEPRELTLGDDPDWIWFGQQMIAICTQPDWQAWNTKNSINFSRMMGEAPKVFARMSAAIAKARDTNAAEEATPKKRGRPRKEESENSQPAQ